MKNIALLLILSFLGGCTVSANNHHFELEGYESKSYDNFSNTWCFVSSNAGDVVMCSSPYERHSKSIGVIVPIVPQTDRESRLAYDIIRERTVQFKNSSVLNSIRLALPSGFEVCTDSYAQNCSVSASAKIEPGESLWLKVPEGAIHNVGMTIGDNKFKAVLKEFIESRWHQVSV
jgi:hypothetical protein